MAKNTKPLSRNKMTREHVKNQVSKLYIQNKSVLEIQEHLKLTRGRVNKFIAEILEEWRQARVAMVESRLEKEIRKIDLVEYEAWANLEASKVKNENVADPRFMAVVQKCVEQRCELQGLVKAVRGEQRLPNDLLDTRSQDAGEMERIMGNPDSMTPEELDERIKLAEQMQEIQGRFQSFSEKLGSGNN